MVLNISIGDTYFSVGPLARSNDYLVENWTFTKDVYDLKRASMGNFFLERADAEAYLEKVKELNQVELLVVDSNVNYEVYNKETEETVEIFCGTLISSSGYIHEFLKDNGDKITVSGFGPNSFREILGAQDV